MFSICGALKVTCSVVLFFVVFAVSVPLVCGAVIEPSLASVMAKASGDSLLLVVIRPRGSVNSSKLKSDLAPFSLTVS